MGLLDDMMGTRGVPPTNPANKPGLLDDLISTGNQQRSWMPSTGPTSGTDDQTVTERVVGWIGKGLKSLVPSDISNWGGDVQTISGPEEAEAVGRSSGAVLGSIPVGLASIPAFIGGAASFVPSTMVEGPSAAYKRMSETMSAPAEVAWGKPGPENDPEYKALEVPFYPIKMSGEGWRQVGNILEESLPNITVPAEGEGSMGTVGATPPPPKQGLGRWLAEEEFIPPSLDVRTITSPATSTTRLTSIEPALATVGELSALASLGGKDAVASRARSIRDAVLPRGLEDVGSPEPGVVRSTVIDRMPELPPPPPPKVPLAPIERGYEGVMPRPSVEELASPAFPYDLGKPKEAIDQMSVDFEDVVGSLGKELVPKESAPNIDALERGMDLAAGRESYNPSVPRPQGLEDVYLGSGLGAGQRIWESFFSPTAKLLREKGEDHMPGHEWLKRIQAWNSKFPSIREENKWNGLEEFISSKGSNKITKNEITDFLDASKSGWLERVEMPDDRFVQYNIPGGIDGTEKIWILKIPQSKMLSELENDWTSTRENMRRVVSELEDKYGSYMSRWPKDAMDKYRGAVWEADIAHQKYKEMSRISRENMYESPHFPDIVNPVLHIRTQEIIDGEGRKGLLAETIQSDWHQQRRGEKGGEGSPTIPPAPFQDSWHAAAIKHLIDIAKDDPEIEWVGWTSGQVQNRRWGKEIQGQRNYEPYERDGKWYVFDTVNEVVTDSGPFRTEREADLRAGEMTKASLGHFLPLLYDTILPKFAKKYVEKLGGRYSKDVIEGANRKKYEQSVIQQEFDRGYIDKEEYTSLMRELEDSEHPYVKGADSYPIHRIDITPTMRNTVKEQGQPFYSGLDITRTPEMVKGVIDTAKELDNELAREAVPTLHDTQNIKATGDWGPLKKRLLKDALGYSAERTVVSELLQNAFDASRGTDKPIHVSVTGDNLVVRDYGLGMTPDVVRDDFVNLFKQGTKGEEDMGGFGLAKLPIMGWPDSFSVVTVAKVPGVGKVRSFVFGDRDSYMNEHKVGFRSEIADPNTPTGTEVHLKKQGLSDSIINGVVDDYMGKMKGGNTIVFEDSQGNVRRLVPDKFENLDSMYEPIRISNAGSNIEIKFVKRDSYGWGDGPYKIAAHVYNKGLLLPDIPQYTQIGKFRLSRKPNFSIEINFSKTPPASDSENYPFLVNRTRLSTWAERNIVDKVEETIRDLERHISKTSEEDLRRVFNTATTVGGIKVVVPFKEPDIVADVNRVVGYYAPALNELGKLYKSFSAMVEKYSGFGAHKFAITTHPDLHGFRPNSSVVGDKYILINPFSYLKDKYGADAAADLWDKGIPWTDAELRSASTGLIDTMSHEIAHEKAHGHYVNYVQEFHRLQRSLTHKNLATLERKAYDFFKKYGESIHNAARDIGRVQEKGTLSDVFSNYTPDEQRIGERTLEKQRGENVAGGKEAGGVILGSGIGGGHGVDIHQAVKDLLSPDPIRTHDPIKSLVEGLPVGSRYTSGWLDKVRQAKSYLYENLHSPKVVLGGDPVGARIYKALDQADIKKNQFLSQQGEEFIKALGRIKEGSSSSTRIGSALDGKMDVEMLTPKERTLHDFFKSKYDFLINQYARLRAGSDEAYMKVLRKALNTHEAKVRLEDLDPVTREEYAKLRSELDKTRGGKKVADLDEETSAKYWDIRDKMNTVLHREWLNSLTEGEQEAFRALTHRVKDYLPHILDRDTVLNDMKVEMGRLEHKLYLSTNKSAETGIKNRIKQLEEAIGRLEGGGYVAYDMIPRNVRFRFFETRKGKHGYSFDAVKAYQTYLSGIARKMFDEGAIREASQMFPDLNPELKPYAKWYLRHFSGMDRSKGDALAGTISGLQWMRTLGLNPRSALANLSQRINTVVEVGVGIAAKAEKMAMTKEGRDLFDSTGIAREVPQVLFEGGQLPPGLEKLRMISGWLFNRVEIANRRHAFLSGYLQAESMGMGRDAAIKHGVDIAHKTQFRYGRIGMPKAMTTPMGKVGLQFMSYPIKQIELIVDWAKHDPVKLLKYLAMAEGINMTLQRAFNMDLSNALGIGITWGEVIEALRSATKADWRAMWRHTRLSLAVGGGLLPSGLSPTVSSAVKVASSFSEGKGLATLAKELTPIMATRTSQLIKGVSNKDARGTYPVYNDRGEPTVRLTGPQLVQRTIGPRTFTETSKVLTDRRARLLEEERTSVKHEILDLLTDGKYKDARDVMRKYGVVPSDQEINNAFMRKKFTRSELERERLEKSRTLPQKYQYQMHREGRLYY